MKGLRDPLKDSLCTGPKPMAILRSALGLHLSVYMRDLFVWTGGLPHLNGLPFRTTEFVFLTSGALVKILSLWLDRIDGCQKPKQTPEKFV